MRQAVHRFRCSAFRRRRSGRLRIVVVAVLAAAANAVLVAYQVHPATWAVWWGS
jgi:hypothetical protein